jgi:hypothetical protein
MKEVTMKRNVAWIVGMGVLSLGAAFTLHGSDNPWGQDYAISSTPGFTPNHLEPTHTVGRFQFPLLLSEQDTFATYVYTYGDVVIFSYEDLSEFEVVDSEGNTVWSGTLMEDEYECIGELAGGVYMITSPKGFSVLSGDPFLEGLGCWYAVDENSRPISTKLLSVGPKNTPTGYDAVLVVFAYNDNTHVVVTNKENGQIIWEGDLDSAEYYLREDGDPTPIAYSVEATRPVSTMTACGVNGMYVPAFNGTFTGRVFMTYQHQWSDAPQDINFVPWEDNTTVTVVDLDNPADTIYSLLCENRGEIKGFAVPLSGGGRPLYIHADKDISVSQTEWISFGTSYVAFYMVRGIDRDGLGLGREFYVPLQASVSFPDLDIFSRLHVIAFSDSTDFIVTRIPRDGGDETTIYEGTLNRGDFYRYTCPLDDSAAVAIYHVTATERVATVASCNDRQGSDFFPVVNLPAIGISEEPPATPVTRPLNWQVLTPVGQQIILQYKDCPQGFHASVFDAAGRRVDELKSPAQNGVLTWGEKYSPGVYFIRVESDTSGSRKKVVLMK